jgi:hypothetical protein
MKHFFTISLCFLALSLSAQETITYPYNPDGDADGLIEVSDLADLLGVYGTTFLPESIIVNSTNLGDFLDSLQNQIDSLDSRLIILESMVGCGVPHACNYSATIPIQVYELCQFPLVGHNCEGEFIGYEVGDYVNDGIVVEVWNNGANGRVMSVQDVGNEVWGCPDLELPNSAGGSGAINTQNMINSCEPPNAATVAVSLGEGWFLPSQQELYYGMAVLAGTNNWWDQVIENSMWGTESARMLDTFKYHIGWQNISNEWYWSSSNNYPWAAWACKLSSSVDNNGLQTESVHPKVLLENIRAVKTF